MLFELHNRLLVSRTEHCPHCTDEGSRIKGFCALTFAWLERGNTRAELGWSLLCSTMLLWRHLLKHLRGNKTLWRVPLLRFFELGWTKMVCNYPEIVCERFTSQEIKTPLSKWLKIIFNFTVTCWVETSILIPLYLTIIIPNYHSILMDAFYFDQNMIFPPHVIWGALFLNSLGLLLKLIAASHQQNWVIETSTFFLLGFSVSLYLALFALTNFKDIIFHFFLPFWYYQNNNDF